MCPERQWNDKMFDLWYESFGVYQVFFHNLLSIMCGIIQDDVHLYLIRIDKKEHQDVMQQIYRQFSVTYKLAQHGTEI